MSQPGSSSHISAPDTAARLAVRERPDRWAVWRQRWSDLLFLHWRVDPAQVQAGLPRGLHVDTFGGAAYVGIVPFKMERVRPAGLPPLPWLSWFLELNVRTYVHDAHGRPGVWFYSLDCNQPFAVALARRFFHLPYFRAHMECERLDERIQYRCRRESAPEPGWSYEWTPSPGARTAEPGSLEFFLLERYLLFSAAPDGQLFSGRVHHEPYRFDAVALGGHSVGPARAAGFACEGAPESVLGADPVDVSVFALEAFGGAVDDMDYRD